MAAWSNNGSHPAKAVGHRKNCVTINEAISIVIPRLNLVPKMMLSVTTIANFDIAPKWAKRR
jgi:hypothetical protein